MSTTSPFLSDFDLHLLSEGTHYRTYDKLGAHVRESEGVRGTHFAVWAPNAKAVSVIGDFNGWRWGEHPMRQHALTGVWEAFIPGVVEGTLYKYAITSNIGNYFVEKADPYAFASEIRPKTASKVATLESYEWSDGAWMKERERHNALDAPISIYEVHLGSWMRKAEENGRWLTYAEMTPLLVDYVSRMGYTHVELLPVAEHPFDGSWGYQAVGYFSPTSRFGDPLGLMALIDALHQANIGVFLDWVPGHFPEDEHGLGFFDGSHLFEHADPRQGRHRQWNTFIFNYGRREVSNFLISNALFWLDKYHIDGLRVDAVASMLYLDFGRDAGDWVPNAFGGRENLEALDFLRRFNERVHEEYPDVLTMAEDSTSWPMVTRPTHVGGLGFDLKWNMGWMNDMLKYMALDPVYRSYSHQLITFSLMYAFNENFILPFSHDEVVHLKKAMLTKMPGDDWQKFANLRLLYGYMTGHPGKKLLFMGQDFGQWGEWNHDFSLDWNLTAFERHRQLQAWVKDLNHLYTGTPALYEGDSREWGFKWIDCDDSARSIVSFVRYGEDPDTALLFVCNFTPVPRHDYRIGLPWGGEWQEVLNSDAPEYGGSGVGNCGRIEAEAEPMHNQTQSAILSLPPLGVLVFRGVRPPEPELEPQAEAILPRSAAKKALDRAEVAPAKVSKPGVKRIKSAGSNGRKS